MNEYCGVLGLLVVGSMESLQSKRGLPSRRDPMADFWSVRDWAIELERSGPRRPRRQRTSQEKQFCWFSHSDGIVAVDWSTAGVSWPCVCSNLAVSAVPQLLRTGRGRGRGRGWEHRCGPSRPFSSPLLPPSPDLTMASLSRPHSVASLSMAP